jgi:hypothetical protein
VFRNGKTRALKSRVAGAAFVFSAAASVLIASPGIAHAANWGTMRNGYRLCLDDTNYGKNQGNQMQVYKCNGLATQNWHILSFRDTSNGAIEYMLQVEESGMCLDEFQQTGSKVVQWTCNSNDPAQWWISTQNANGGFNLCSAFCLSGGGTSGNKVTANNVQPVPNTGPTDSWTIPPLA